MAAGPALDHARLTTVWSLVAYHADVRGDAGALQFEGRQTSYSGLRHAALLMAARLRTLGVGPGSRVAYLGKNTDDYFILLFALARLKAVIVPLNWRLSPDEWAYIVRAAGAMRLFCDAPFAEAAQRLADACRILPAALPVNGTELASLVPAHADGVEGVVALPEPGDVVFQVYTSGTTGRPKGALLTNRSLLALRAPGYKAGLHWFPQPEETVIVALPVAHIAGTAYALFGFYAGGRIVVAREFVPAEVLSLIDREKGNHTILAPAAMQMLMDCPEAVQTDFSSLRCITYGAAPIPEAQLRQSQAVFGCGFVQMYGLSEASGGVVALTPEDHVSDIPGRLRSAGRPMPGVEIAIVDPDGRPLTGDGSEGEIAVRSDAVMEGYWNLPDATKTTLLPGGWLRTGDIGRIDADGYLHVLDRVKDMIISGGENVYPAEVENAIFGHPGVVDVAVIGVPSDRWGEEVAAIIVPRGGHAPSLGDIQQWVEGKLARYKVPRQLHLAAELPRNAGNKILRKELREPFWAGHERRVN